MALNRWLGAALIVSVFGFGGCAEPKKKNAGSTPPPVQTTVKEDGGEMAKDEMAKDGGEMAKDEMAKDGGDMSAVKTDYEDADGLLGYEEVLALEVPPSDAAMIAKGKELFVANCTSCHGDQGLGDGTAGASLDPKPRNLTAIDEYKYGHLELALYRTGAYGVEGTGMAPWGDILEPEEQWAITHYIRTIQK